MADQQPEDVDPAGTRQHEEPPSTAVLAARGSAAIPPPSRRRRWWSRRPADGADRPAPTAASTTTRTHATAPAESTRPLPADEPDHWVQHDDGWDVTPAVDPWADVATADGRDTAWLPAPADPTHEQYPTWPPPRQPQPPPRQTEPPPRQTEPAPREPKPAPREPKPAPQPRQRRRRLPRTLFVLTLVTAVCCCGVPGYYAWPAARQYPASATLPTSVADLRLRDDGASRRAADRLTRELIDVDLVADDVFAGSYGDGDGKRVTLFGMTGFRLTPQDDLEAQMQRLADDYGLTSVSAYDLGETGAHERCGVGRANGTSVVVCAWADHGSLASALITRRSIDDSAELLALLRDAVLTRS